MKPSKPFTRAYKNPDALRWFIVGAYQAGASEPEIASLTTLSRQTVNCIIKCFQRTGVPNVRRRKRTKIRTNTKRCLIQYDAWTELDENYSESSSDEQYDTECDNSDMGLDIKKEEQDEKHLAWKQALYFRRKGKSSATDTIDYVLYKGRKHEEKRISAWQISQEQLQKDDQKHDDSDNQYDTESPSPPPSHSNNLLIPKSESSSASPEANHPPPPSPPPSSQQLCIPSLYTLINTTNTNTSSPPSSPTSNDPNQHMDEYLTISISSSSSSSSSTSSSSVSSPTLQRPSAEDHHENYCYSSSPYPFNYWSRADDKLLLHYVLTRMQCWDELECVFGGRHSAMDCSERWDLLQHYLLKELKKASTYSW